MKKKITAIALAVMMSATTMAPLVSAMSFTDISGLNTIQLTVLEDSVNKGIITGYEDNTVRPYGTLTRAEFAAMICRYMGYEIGGNSSFSDAASHWASGYIQACVDKGAINGIGNNLFDPEAPVTFNQATKIVSIVSGMTNGFDIDGLGGYPLAFLTVGQSGGLFSNLTAGMTGEDYPLSRIDAIVMLNNAGVKYNSGSNVTSNVSMNSETEGKMVITAAQIRDEVEGFVEAEIPYTTEKWNDTVDKKREIMTDIICDYFKAFYSGTMSEYLGLDGLGQPMSPSDRLCDNISKAMKDANIKLLAGEDVGLADLAHTGIIAHIINIFADEGYIIGLGNVVYQE
ncbi:MAG: S-layer homology domain-containing protein [bacterium]|nr:S-layer homology domain-containing protein [bacterium]